MLMLMFPHDQGDDGKRFMYTSCKDADLSGGVPIVVAFDLRSRSPETRS